MGLASGLFFDGKSDTETLYNRITPSSDQIEEQQERWNQLAEFLLPDLKDRSGYPVRHWLQGSYKFGTQIRPVRKWEEMDIDLGVYFCWDGAPEEGDFTPVQFKGMVQSALTAYASGNADVKCVLNPPKPRCSRISYSGGFHIDVPCYHLSPEGDTRHLATSSDKWEWSDPKALYTWFRDAFSDDYRTRVRRQIRYFKAWAALKWPDEKGRPTSVLLTVLVAEAALETDISNRPDDDALFEILTYVLAAARSGKHVSNPVDRSENLAARFSDTEWEAMVSKLEEFFSYAEKALAATTEMEAADHWQSVFAYMIPMPEDAVAPVRNLPAVTYMPEVRVKATGTGFSKVEMNGIGPIPKNCDIEFEVINPERIPYGAQIVWTVRNEGAEAAEENDLGHVRTQTGLNASETSAYKGRHFMDCAVRMNGRLLALRRIPVLISGSQRTRRNPVSRPDWVRFRK